MWANKIQTLRENSSIYKPLQERLDALQSLRRTLHKYESQILEALYKDLHKHSSEAFLTELFQVYEELEFMITNLPKLMRPKKSQNTTDTFWLNK